MHLAAQKETIQPQLLHERLHTIESTRIPAPRLDAAWHEDGHEDAHQRAFHDETLVPRLSSQDARPKHIEMADLRVSLGGLEISEMVASHL